MSVSVEISDNLAVLSGDLLFSTVLSIRSEIESAIDKTAQPFVIDFGSVSRVDSSAVSLWLCLQRRAQHRKSELKAQNVPVELSSIAQLVGLESFGLAG